MNKEIIRAENMKLGDIVAQNLPFVSPYSHSTVKQIKDGYVTLFRPHVVCGDYSYTGGVPVSIGIEEYTVAFGHPMEYVLIEAGRALR